VRKNGKQDEVEEERKGKRKHSKNKEPKKRR
jgi:hypothetical protein